MRLFDIFSAENQAESWEKITLERIFVIYYYMLNWKANLIGRGIAEFFLFPDTSGCNMLQPRVILS